MDEESLESRELEHGYFTYFLLQAIKASKGNAPTSQIFNAAARQVSKRASAQGLRQHPVMTRSSEDADFRLGVPGAAPASAARKRPGIDHFYRLRAPFLRARRCGYGSPHRCG
jgi:hypothetical protein